MRDLYHCDPHALYRGGALRMVRPQEMCEASWMALAGGLVVILNR